MVVFVLGGRCEPANAALTVAGVGESGEKKMLILLVDDDDRDAFLFERSMQSAAPTATCYRVKSPAEAHWYLLGLGRYSDRERFPLPRVVVVRTTRECSAPTPLAAYSSSSFWVTVKLTRPRITSSRRLSRILIMMLGHDTRLFPGMTSNAGF